jgi:signal recognition particle subunit SRP54
MTENSIAPALKSVRRALLDADVNLDVAATLIDGVKRRSLGQEVIKGVTAEQMFIKAMYDEVRLTFLPLLLICIHWYFLTITCANVHDI